MIKIKTPFRIFVFLFLGLMLTGCGAAEQAKTKAAYAHSIKPTEAEAVEEAVSAIKTKITEPDYIIVYSTVKDEALGLQGYDPEVVLKEVNRLLPNTKVYGGTSHLAVLTGDGYQLGKPAALAMLGISSPNITFGVGGVNVADYSSPKEAGKAAIQAAIKNAGKEGQLPQLVLIMGSLGNEEGLLAGVEEVIGWGIPVIGGSAADNTVFTGLWREFANDKAYFNGVTLTAIYTNEEIGYAYETGFEKQDKQGVLTKAEGRVIYEIDNKPAADVFNEWCNGCIADKLETGGMGIPALTIRALAKVIESETGIYYLSIAVVGIGQDKSLIAVANVTTGDNVVYMEGNPKAIVNKSKTTAQKAMSVKNISKGKPLFGISTTCAGLQLITPEEDKLSFSSAIGGEIGETVPLIGAFTFGEQGPLGVVNHHGNLINSMIVFSEKE